MKRLVACVGNTGHPTSLELRKIYQALPDRDAEAHGLMRVVDEPGEDYLYPGRFFVAVDLPRPVVDAFRRNAAWRRECRRDRRAAPRSAKWSCQTREEDRR